MTGLEGVFQKHNPMNWRAEPVTQFLDNGEVRLAMIYEGQYWLARLEAPKLRIDGGRGGHHGPVLQWTPYFGPVSQIDYDALGLRPAEVAA